MADRHAFVRVFKLLVFGYPMVILGIVAALLVWPLSRLLNLAPFCDARHFFLKSLPLDRSCAAVAYFPHISR
jgi:hypothetical protein